MPRIAIDLTPLLPGGENGGAKLLILELLSQFKKLSHDFDFLLLTAYWNHEDLAIFDGPKFQRLCVFHAPPSSNQPKTIANPVFSDRIKNQLRQAKLIRAIPLLLPLSRLLKQIWSKSLNHPLSPIVPKSLLQDQGVSLLFCPFTKPNYAEPDIPIVSIFYDLQHRTYPQFFLPLERERRDATLIQLSQRVESIICISEFSRRTLLEDLKISPERTYTIPVCIHSRLRETPSALSILETLGLNVRPYFFYPANFWPHKNHPMLLNAYNMFLRRNPGLNIDLVFTGALSQPEQELRATVEAMGLKERVHFLGYLSEEQLAAVLQGCRLMIFPSLYEGFGIPIIRGLCLR